MRVHWSGKVLVHGRHSGTGERERQRDREREAGNCVWIFEMVVCVGVLLILERGGWGWEN